MIVVVYVFAAAVNNRLLIVRIHDTTSGSIQEPIIMIMTLISHSHRKQLKAFYFCNLSAG